MSDDKGSFSGLFDNTSKMHMFNWRAFMLYPTAFKFCQAPLIMTCVFDSVFNWATVSTSLYLIYLQCYDEFDELLENRDCFFLYFGIQIILASFEGQIHYVFSKLMCKNFTDLWYTHT